MSSWGDEIWEEEAEEEVGGTGLNLPLVALKLEQGPHVGGL